LFSLLDTINFISEGGGGLGFFMSVSSESSYFISFSQQAQSWNICMPNISNAKKNPGHLYLTLFTGLPVTLSTQLFA
jgi:hypothetical protein